MALEALTSYDKLKLGNTVLRVYQMLVQHIARDNSGLSLARSKDATCFLRWIMSVMSDTTVQTCHQRAIRSKTMERRVVTVILNVYQSTGIAKGDGSRQSLENHGKVDEMRRFTHKKFGEDNDVHSSLALAEDYSRPTKRGEYQYVSGVMGIAYNPFLDSEAENACMNFEVVELLKFWMEKIIETDPTERERPSLRLLLEKIPEVISVPLSDKKVELRLGSAEDVLSTNLGTIWKLLRPSRCQHPHASLIEEVTLRVRLSPAKDEDLGNLKIVHKLILPHQEKSEGAMSKLDKFVKKMEPGRCLDLACGGGEQSCDGRSCVRIQSFQSEDLVTWLGDITQKEKSEVQIVAEL